MSQLKPHELSIVLSVAAYERESGHSLPDDSFYKSLARAIMRKYNLTIGA